MSAFLRPLFYSPIRFSPSISLGNRLCTKGNSYSRRTFSKIETSGSNEELKPFSLKARSIKPGSIFEHYKGKCYEVIAVGRHSEDLKEMVVYKALYGNGDVWIRPLEMFCETITIGDETKQRFSLITKPLIQICEYTFLECI